MEITPQVAQTMIDSRFHEYPQLKEVVMDQNLKEKLEQIIDFVQIDKNLFPQIETEILIVLTLYAPLYELAGNIADSTGISEEKAEAIASLIDAVILSPVRDDLYAFEYLWKQEIKKGNAPLPDANKEMREKLELRPESAPITGEDGNVQPLTREEVLRALAPARTMASDIATLRQKKETGSVLGYGSQDDKVEKK